MNTDVLIIGAGPAGLYTALNIRNKDVIVVEEHKTPGSPKHCAGIIGEYVANIVSGLSRRLIDSSYKKILFISPLGKIYLEFKTPIAYHVKRPQLEEVLASRVESLGHRIIYGHRAKPRNTSTVYLRGIDIGFKYLVVGEGPRGVFQEKLLGINRDYLVGFQFTARTRSVEEDQIIIVYSEYTPEFFAWITPLSNTEIQVGYASRYPREQVLRKIATKYAGVEITSIMEKYGGLIPVNKPLRNPIIHGRIIFHGDSVPLTKPYTGGGLYYIFKLTPILAYAIEMGNPELYLQEYKKTYLVKNTIEYTLVSITRKTRYYLPLVFIEKLSRIKVLEQEDFDKHYRVFLKSIGLMPFQWVFSLLKHTS